MIPTSSPLPRAGIQSTRSIVPWPKMPPRRTAVLNDRMNAKLFSLRVPVDAVPEVDRFVSRRGGELRRSLRRRPRRDTPSRGEAEQAVDRAAPRTEEPRAPRRRSRRCFARTWPRPTCTVARAVGWPIEVMAGGAMVSPGNCAPARVGRGECQRNGRRARSRSGQGGATPERSAASRQKNR